MKSIAHEKRSIELCHEGKVSQKRAVKGIAALQTKGQDDGESRS